MCVIEVMSLNMNLIVVIWWGFYIIIIIIKWPDRELLLAAGRIKLNYRVNKIRRALIIIYINFIDIHILNY